MELMILGSAAAEGWPAMFCACEPCARARELGGKDLRRRTSYRLGEHIQIDWGPDTFGASLAFGLDTSALTDLVMTHRHEDHLAVYELYYRRSGYSQVPEDAILNVHGSPEVMAAITDRHEDPETYRLCLQPLGPRAERTIADGVVITSLLASHAKQYGEAYNYILRVGERKLLLANDTGWWEDDVWEFLGGHRFDVVVMDSTYGFRDETHHHLGCPNVVQAKDALAAQGSLAEGCRFVANHFSHNGVWLHAEMEEFFAPHSIEVGFDGMKIEI